MRKALLAALTLQLIAAPAHAQWSAWSIRDAVNGLTDERRIALVSGSGRGGTEHFVMLICYGDGEHPPWVVLRDGRLHIGRTRVAYRFDDGDVVQADFHTASGGDGDLGVYDADEHYQSFKRGLVRASRLRFQIEGREVFDVPLTGSTAGVSDYEARCSELGARH